jgi:TusA-related sulfurtransferase
MTTDSEPTDVLDATGLSCPMPVVRTKQAVDELPSGAVLEVRATDAGSVSDLAGWAEATPGVSLAGQSERQRDGRTVYVHHVRVA